MNCQKTVNCLTRLPFEVTEIINSFLFYPASYTQTVRFKRTLVQTFALAATSRKHPRLCYEWQYEDPDTCETWAIWLDPYTILKYNYEEANFIRAEIQFSQWNCRRCGHYDAMALSADEVSPTSLPRLVCTGHPEDIAATALHES